MYYGQVKKNKFSNSTILKKVLLFFRYRVSLSRIWAKNLRNLRKSIAKCQPYLILKACGNIKYIWMIFAFPLLFSNISNFNWTNSILEIARFLLHFFTKKHTPQRIFFSHHFFAKNLRMTDIFFCKNAAKNRALEKCQKTEFFEVMECLFKLQNELERRYPRILAE